MEPAFRVFLNKRRQWVDVFVAEEPREFMRKHDAYGYYNLHEERKVYSGLFGSLYFCALDDSPDGVDLIIHEVEHLFVDWMRSRGIVISERNEERMALIRGAFMRSFWRGFRKWQKQKK